MQKVAFLIWRYDVTKFSSQEGNKSSNSNIYPRKTGLTCKKMSFYVKKRSFRPKLDPQINFSNFETKEICSFPEFLRCLDEKRAAATPLIDKVL